MSDGGQGEERHCEGDNQAELPGQELGEVDPSAGQSR